MGLEHESSKHTMWERFVLNRRFGHWLHREDSNVNEGQSQDGEEARGGLGRRLSRRVVPGLPRPGTFKRQESERRERLMPHEPGPFERRAVSADRRRAVSTRRSISRTISPHMVPIVPSISAPTIPSPPTDEATNILKDQKDTVSVTDVVEIPTSATAKPPPPALSIIDGYSEAGGLPDGLGEDMLAAELEEKWILNLSMHFKDRSDREKFFVTYAETPNKWRRVTVSCDYRSAQPDSLEGDLKELQYQRDKSARIYESIRESLADIQFYDTVTNLKLETDEGRLHVHVTEDVHEIIQYPPVESIAHLQCPRFPESSLQFDSHLSGFVYKVKVDGRVFIKKEIPGPDTVEEFLYEINALHALCGSNSVIHFGGVIVDDYDKVVKGLIISFAEQGALVDLLYDLKGHLPWERRERWAKQIVQGLSEIHEGGFVQGDFTLSNIVIDDNDDAKIIDINRRGCPVGWEPPEIAALIQSSQRISMYIGVKSDLFQLGMVLWALAEEEDEPERKPRPLTLSDNDSGIPQYYHDLIRICLSDQPQRRLSARDLLSRFPFTINDSAAQRPMHETRRSHSNPSEKRYIDPSAAVEREDIARFRAFQAATATNQLDDEAEVEELTTADERTYVNAPDGSSDLRFDSSGSYIVAQTRGRQPALNTRHLDPVLNGTGASTADDSELDAQIIPISPSDERRWEEFEVEGHPYLIHRSDLRLKDEDLNLDGGVAEAKEGGASDGGKTSLASGRAGSENKQQEAMVFGPLTGDLAGVGAHTTLEDCSPRGRG
ncbi:MAG: hypothetical protein M1812_006294 [Candelaria pacifica]|nr:MAG: hypothetical protein M1812_006294 [Candelaria pacifica]